MRGFAATVLLAILTVPANAGASGICGDVNSNEDVNAVDALLVLKSGVGQPVALLCGPRGELAQTGQATAYGTGSDGDLQIGLPRGFADNGDGTVTDYTTGLQWEKKDDSGGIHDRDRVFSWSSMLSIIMSGSLNSELLATLNAGGGFAGHTDWRIPNRVELESLVDLGAFNPSSFEAFHDGCTPGCNVWACSCTADANYWSSTTFAGSSGSAWAVNFVAGISAIADKTTSVHARAVRNATLPEIQPTCQAPDPPQCLHGDPCSNGTCSTTRGSCGYQHDCPLAPEEQCCCQGICL